MKVELSAEAQAQVLRIDAWWRENRPAAPGLFADELFAAIEQLEAVPTLGARYPPKKSFRRLLLHRTHSHLYMTEVGERLVIVSVWSAFRGAGPVL